MTQCTGPILLMPEEDGGFSVSLTALPGYIESVEEDREQITGKHIG